MRFNSEFKGLITIVFLQENLLFPQFSHRASVSLVLFLVKHLSPIFPAHRCVPTLLFVSQGLIFSSSPSLTFSFRCCVTLPVRFHCLAYTWHVLTNSCTSVFHKGFPSKPPMCLIYLRGPSREQSKMLLRTKISYFFPHCSFIYYFSINFI